MSEQDCKTCDTFKAPPRGVMGETQREELRGRQGTLLLYSGVLSENCSRFVVRMVACEIAVLPIFS